ncbi:MAG: tetratricopeptide repeat protein [Flavipsychrobacter sp.]|nr:tetratricopeptide repeat protein [Flavipsychrobacter sp.]
MKHFLAIVLVFCFHICYCQQIVDVNVDSLNNNVENAGTAQDRVRALCDLSFAYYRVSPDSGLRYGFEALDLARKVSYENGVANAHKHIAINYIALSEYAKAIENLLAALAIFEKLEDKEQIASVYNKLGLVYSYNNDPKALSYCEKALHLYKSINDTNGIAQVYGNMGNVYFFLAKYSEALSAYKLALDQCKKQQDRYGMAQNIQNIAMVNTVNADYSEAFDNTKQALSINEQLNNLYGLAISKGNMGVLYLYVLKDSVTKFKLPVGRTQALQTAIQYLEESIKLSQKLGAIDIAQNFYKDLSEAESLIGNANNALKYYKRYNEYKDSIYSRKNLQKIAYLETERDIYIKDKQIQINELKLEKRNSQILLISIAGILVLLVLVVLFKERRKSERLLLNILPTVIAARLKNKEHPIADYLPEVSVLFVDMVGFTKYTSETDPKKVVNMLNEIFTIFDDIAGKYKMEKIKTIGDCYMAVAGAPIAMQNHTEAAANMALEIKSMITSIRENFGDHIDFRVGLDCGPAIGGVLGKRKFVYDIWGDTVNTASRMESSGAAGEIHCTSNFKTATDKLFVFTARELMQIKSKGLMQTWLLIAKK